MQQRKKKQSKPLNKFLRFSGIAIQMGATIYLAHLLGIWIDGKLGSEKELYMKICTLFGVFISIYSVIREVSKLSKND